jgi:ketosteroid isomerase-like protein
MTNQPTGADAHATELERFIQRCQDALLHHIKGDPAPYLEVWSHDDDVVVFGAVGSYIRGWEDVRTHLIVAGKATHLTSLEVERISTIVTDDLAVSAVIERMSGQVNSAAEGVARRITHVVRVTHTYRRERGQWRLIFRHANILTPEDEDRERAILGRETASVRAP